MLLAFAAFCISHINIVCTTMLCFTATVHVSIEFCLFSRQELHGSAAMTERNKKTVII